VPTTLSFQMSVRGEPFVCGETYPDIGEPPADYTLTDGRFYAYDFALIDDERVAHPVTLDDGPYQGAGVALLDFEDGCGPDGTPELNTVVTGMVAPGSFNGVRFTLGVPPDQNFIDLVSAPPPLDVSGMFWTWQFGYKFLKIDGSVPSSEGGINPFFLHLGSSGCPGTNPESPPNGACLYPNRVTYPLDGYSATDGLVIADLAEVFALSNLATNTDGTAPGCMSEPEDPECQTLLPRLGLNDAGEQFFFSAE
jgi:uncharacterized repeat protein (TIGR04052 family)